MGGFGGMAKMGGWVGRGGMKWAGGILYYRVVFASVHFSGQDGPSSTFDLPALPSKVPELSCPVMLEATPAVEMMFS